MNASVSLLFDEGKTHRFSSDLIGFTHAHDCVQQPLQKTCHCWAGLDVETVCVIRTYAELLHTC